jgi:hypothetical protein
MEEFCAGEEAIIARTLFVACWSHGIDSIAEELETGLAHLELRSC